MQLKTLINEIEKMKKVKDTFICKKCGSIMKGVSGSDKFKCPKCGASFDWYTLKGDRPISSSRKKKT